MNVLLLLIISEPWHTGTGTGARKSSLCSDKNLNKCQGNSQPKFQQAPCDLPLNFLYFSKINNVKNNNVTIIYKSYILLS